MRKSLQDDLSKSRAPRDYSAPLKTPAPLRAVVLADSSMLVGLAYQPKTRPGGPLGPSYRYDPESEVGVLTKCGKLDPKIQLDLDDLAIKRRVELLKVERERLAAFDFPEIPLPQVNRKLAREIADAQELDFHACPEGSSEWRKPGTRFEPKVKRFFKAHGTR